MSRVTEKDPAVTVLTACSYFCFTNVHMCVCTQNPKYPELHGGAGLESGLKPVRKDKRLCRFCFPCLWVSEFVSGAFLFPWKKGSWGGWGDYSPRLGQEGRSCLHGTSLNVASTPLEINCADPCAKTMLLCIFLWLRILHIFLYVNSCCFFFCEVCVIGPFISWGLWLHGKVHQEKALMWGSPKASCQYHHVGITWRPKGQEV